MVTAQDVRSAYALFLGREPESDTVVQDYMRCPTIEALTLAFLKSTEFQNRWPQFAGATRDRLLGDASMQVEAEVPAATLAEMLSRIGGIWTELGTTEPYWSVLSAEHFKRDEFEQNRDYFYKSAERDFAVVNAFLARAGKQLPENG